MPARLPLLVSCPCTSAGDCQILTGRSGPVSYEVTTFFLGSWYVWDLVCTPPSPANCAHPPTADVRVGPGVPISNLEVLPRAPAGGSHQLAEKLRPERKHKQRGDDLTFNGTTLGPSKTARPKVSSAKLLGGALTNNSRRSPLFPPSPPAYD